MIKEKPELKKEKREIYSEKVEQQYLNELYLGKNNKIISGEINKKRQGYQQQDKRNKKYNGDLFISNNAIIEKLVVSKLKCHYCNNKVCITYNKIREKSQWTLDRINNDFGHNYDNVVISCLDCNLSRRCLDHKKFLFTKKLKIKKSII